MANFEKRIEALEQANPTDNMGPRFIHFVGMGQGDRKIQLITQGNQEWQRQPGESEQDLKDRA